MHAGIVLLMMLTSTTSHSTTVETDMVVSVTVLNTCTVSTDGLNFGTYDPSSKSDLIGSAALSIKCTSGTATKVSLSRGINAIDGTLRMYNGNSTSYINYSLGLSQTWANHVIHMGTGRREEVKIYGTIPKGQEVPDGAYSDVITISVTF